MQSGRRTREIPLQGGFEEPASTAEDRYLNRELSWLAFNSRVLALAEDASLPILERVKFAAIFSENLDHFFQVRVAGLKALADAGVLEPSPDGMSAESQLRALRLRVLDLVTRQDELVKKDLLPRLAEAGIRVWRWSALGAGDRRHVSRIFEQRIFPVLTPLSVDPGHPFPYISNLSFNLAVVVRDPVTGQHRFARVKVPPLVPRFLPLPDGEGLVPVEQVIASHLEALFPGMELISHCAFRVTRDADLALEDEAPDLMVAVASALDRRRRTNAVVRLETEAGISPHVLELLTSELEIQPEDVYPVKGLLGLGGLWALHDLDRPDLKQPAWVPATPPGLAGESAEEPADIFEVLRERDVLVHHPYESFGASVEAFLSQAAADPEVLAIKHTLYRTSGPESPIVGTLTRAAEAGKQVVALVELTARFDEEANIEWARTLERSGVHVVYGLVGLKTHAKVALVVRREADGLRRYFHVGTGNYNPQTARSYEDLGLLSCSPEIGADLTELWNHLTGCSRPRSPRKLLVAPFNLRHVLLEHIRATAASGGRIALKLNNLSDPEIIDALYAASQAGVTVDLIVRSVCCLRPGVPGLSARIRVRSILGRFLEHSRIFRFENGAGGPYYYLGSPDLMPRNLDARVEVVTPVEDPAQKARIEEILAANLEDDVLAWELCADGTWVRVPTRIGVDTQTLLQERARERSRQAEQGHGRPGA